MLGAGGKSAQGEMAAFITESEMRIGRRRVSVRTCRSGGMEGWLMEEMEASVVHV